jgi:cell wall-associated NlpC family hydrolase
MTRRIIVVIAVFLVMMLYPPAVAAAEPPSPASKLAEYKRLTAQAEQLNEDLLNAKVSLDKKRGQLRKANEDLSTAIYVLKQAKTEKQSYQAEVDDLVLAANQGANFSGMSAFLTGGNPHDFLDRASALEVLSQNRDRTIRKMTSAINLATSAFNKAIDSRNTIRTSTQAAKNLVGSIQKTRQNLKSQIETVRDAYNKLTGAEQDTLAGGIDNSIFIGEPGSAGKAAEVAMQQRGKPYVWGAAGPNSFDCSGLVLYAYNTVGISLPHSSRVQYTYGQPVAFGQWKQGDLLFYGGSASSIHHVAMYIGDGMLVHASTEGVPVKTDKAPYGAGSDYIGAKRLAP